MAQSLEELLSSSAAGKVPSQAMMDEYRKLKPGVERAWLPEEEGDMSPSLVAELLNPVDVIPNILTGGLAQPAIKSTGGALGALAKSLLTPKGIVKSLKNFDLKEAMLWANPVPAAPILGRMAVKPFKTLWEHADDLGAKIGIPRPPASVVGKVKERPYHSTSSARLYEPDFTMPGRMPTSVSPISRAMEPGPAFESVEKIFQSSPLRKEGFSTPIGSKTAEKFKTAQTASKEKATRDALGRESQLETLGFRSPVERKYLASEQKKIKDEFAALGKSEEKKILTSEGGLQTGLPLDRLKKKAPSVSARRKAKPSPGPKGNVKAQEILDMITKSE